MKKIFIFSLVSLAFALSAGNKFLRPVMEMHPVKNFSPARGLNNKVWSKAPEYPLLRLAGLPQEFGLIPPEEGKTAFLYDEKNIYIRAVMSDSDVLSEAVDSTSPIANCADHFCVMLNPAGETGFIYILCTPNAILSANYVTGPGVIRLASANLPLKTKISVYTAINGKINDTKRDKGWNALLVLPMKELIQEIRKSGIGIKENQEWTIMVGRKNYSRFLEKVEMSSYPQTVGTFFNNMHHYAKLSAVKKAPADAR